MKDITNAECARLLGGAIGRRVWAATIGHGSFLTMSLGAPSLSDPSLGEYYLWVYCSAWRIETDLKVVASCEDKPEMMSVGAAMLNDLEFMDFVIDPVSLSTTLVFSGGFRILIFTIYTLDAEHWKVRLPSGHWIQAGPGNILMLSEPNE